MGILKVSVFQKSLENPLDSQQLKKLSALKSDFLVFPEFFAAGSSVKKFADLTAQTVNALEWLLKLSDAYSGILIGGTLPREENGTLYSACPVVYRGEVIDWYRKRFLEENEKKTVQPGLEAGVFILKGFRFGILLGGEVAQSGFYSELAGMGIHLVFAPMCSLLRQESPEQKLERDRVLFVEPAAQNQMSIVKCASIGTFLGRKLQGRSLVVTPTGVSWRVAPAEEGAEILKTVMVNVP